MNEHDSADVDEIDALLRKAAGGEPYLDDAGFTAGVMAQLPAIVDLAWRRWVLLGFGAAAMMLSLLVFGGAAFIWDAAMELVRQHRVGPAQVSVLVFAVMFYWCVYTALGTRKE
jgi:hypothetical protein